VSNHLENSEFLCCTHFQLASHLPVGSKSKHKEMETYETNPDFARVSFLRNTKNAALGVSGFEKRNIRVPRAVSPAIRFHLLVCGASQVRPAGRQAQRTGEILIFLRDRHKFACELHFR